MKNKAKLVGLFLLALVNSQNIASQDVAMNNGRDEVNTENIYNLYVGESSEEEVEVKNTALEEGKYLYQSGNKNVLVVIENGYYTEYHENNEFIKAKIKWSSENEYKLVITEIKKENLPFGVGTKMDTKIVRVKGARFYYESNLQGLTWSGKFLKVEDDLLKK
tara:strand:- start:2172 stop:2660 length:489 start_codon:yes stop_codon:yes gene_type:complete